MEELYTLTEQLHQYTPGDLVAGMEIIDTAEQVLHEQQLTEEQTSLVNEIIVYVKKIVKEGTDASTRETVDSFITRLEKHLEAGKKRAKQVTSTSSVDQGDYEVLFSFIQEAQDHLENIEEKILSIETDNDQELIDAIFRSMHTIKGVSSFLGLNKIKDLSHSLESVLDALRQGSMEVHTEIVDTLLEGTDVVKAMIGELDHRSQELVRDQRPVQDLDSEMDISDIVASLEAIINNDTQKSEQQEPVVNEEMIANFVAESNDMLHQAEQAITDLKHEPENDSLINKAFRTIHTIKGNAGFLGFTMLESLCVDIETVLDRVRTGDHELENMTVDILLDTIEVIRKKVQLIQAGEFEAEEAPVETVYITEEEVPEEVYKPLGEALVESGRVQKEDVEKALQLQQRRLGEILVDEGTVTRETVEKALQKQSTYKKTQVDQITSYKTQRKDIRVDMEKLDKLFDLMGELITAEAMVIDNPDLEQHQLDQFDSSAGYLSKITREMQEITMTIRMIPLEGLFNKMRRLVRDLSRKFEKKVNLTITGQDTEMDRNVIEEISDPLVHIIRNAIDHGVESSEDRVKAGKEETGNIHLDARYEGNEIWISVKDDGRGLNREKIIEKARYHDLLKTDPSTLSDKEVWNLVFEPGFSTAEKVSEISGRGVGMDVVKRNIEKLRGKINIESTQGAGSEIILRIPLTLAIIDGVLMRVGSQLFSVPINDVVSFHKASKREVTKTEGNQEMLRLREEILPVIKLYEYYTVTTEKKAIQDGIVIVTNAGGKKTGILVDEVIGYKQIVVKGLPEYIDEMKSVSGCSILGNGDVSLIIDTNALVHDILL